jgi:hypothetical protein
MLRLAAKLGFQTTAHAEGAQLRRIALDIHEVKALSGLATYAEEQA